MARKTPAGTTNRADGYGSNGAKKSRYPFQRLRNTRSKSVVAAHHDDRMLGMLYRSGGR
jgi:hypothetical protein